MFSIKWSRIYISRQVAKIDNFFVFPACLWVETFLQIFLSIIIIRSAVENGYRYFRISAIENISYNMFWHQWILKDIFTTNHKSDKIQNVNEIKAMSRNTISQPRGIMIFNFDSNAILQFAIAHVKSSAFLHISFVSEM